MHIPVWDSYTAVFVNDDIAAVDIYFFHVLLFKSKLKRNSVSFIHFQRHAVRHEFNGTGG